MAVLGLVLSCTAQTNKKMSDAYAMATVPVAGEKQEVAVFASGCFWGLLGTSREDGEVVPKIGWPKVMQ